MANSDSSALAKPAYFNFAQDVVDCWAAKDKDQQAMFWVSEDYKIERSLSYSHFKVQSHRIALLFERLGVKAGDVVLMILPRVPEWWEIAVAALRIGVIICPATTLLVDKDVEFRCQQTRAKVFIGNDASTGKLQNVRRGCAELKIVIRIDEAASSRDDVVDFREAMKEIPLDAVVKQRRTKAEDPAIIFFTSGTSGPPKMVRHNHVSYPLAHTITGKHWLQLSPGKLYWNLSEQGWAKAAWSFFGAWNCGASLFVHDDRSSFSATRLVDNIHKYPITTLCAPPTAYRQLVLLENQTYLSHHFPRALEHCTGTGEPLNDSVIKVWQQMTAMEIYDGYGQTETVLVCGNFKGTTIKPGSMGKPSPGVPLYVIDGEGGECGVGVEGDIAISRDRKDFFGIFEGYLNNDGTLDHRTKTLDGKQWYLTSDRATRDGDGYFWFVGRADDVINSSGYRIGPFEVESTLKLHPAVIESAVVASPDPTRSEVVKAFIVLTSEYAQKAKSKSSSERLIKEIQEFCKKNASPYKYPRKVQFVDANFLPKTISGKIKRAELKMMEWRKAGQAKL
ncbi:ribosomal protein [Hyphodiscus hymeniophilus]|uniref:medium-chain acyl-CoA ligase n=1 Tax=Hyphodiscus hymeniophilus TaxID=353542 RepID=A0A9P6VHB8_9HELO|nr:ribosomal protein [Hyphodiscus hymeniophilus]